MAQRPARCSDHRLCPHCSRPWYCGSQRLSLVDEYSEELWNSAADSNDPILRVYLLPEVSLPSDDQRPEPVVPPRQPGAVMTGAAMAHGRAARSYTDAQQDLSSGWARHERGEFDTVFIVVLSWFDDGP